MFIAKQNINPHFYSVWRSKDPYNILKGGRNSFKSSVIVLKLVVDMMTYIERGEKANVVVIRKVASTIRDSVFEKVQWALRKVGADKRFKPLVTPFRLIDKVTGSTFYFYGQDDFEKLKGNDINDLIDVWYEEASEFKSSEEFDQTNATFMRQKHKLAPFVKFYWSYNPPRNPYSWINEWVDSLKNAKDYFIHSSSYLNDELGFVTEQLFNEIERIKENDYDYYRYLYLGEAVGLGTNVYNLSSFNIIDDLFEDDPIIEILLGADIGHQTSATAVTRWGITRKGNLVLLDTYYYEPAGRVAKKAPSDMAKDINDFERNEEYAYIPVHSRTIDSAEGGMRNQYFKDFGISWSGANKKEKHVMIDYTHTLLAQGRVFILNNESNQVFIEEVKKYQWDERTIKSDRPQVIKIDDHAIDSWQYLVVNNLRRLGLKH